MIHLGIQRNEVTNNIIAHIPSETKNDEIVILYCHHDSPFRSPIEDASGCSVVLALAKYFASQNSNKRRLLILFIAGHFYGFIGTRTFIEKHKNDIVPKGGIRNID